MQWANCDRGNERGRCTLLATSMVSGAVGLLMMSVSNLCSVDSLQSTEEIDPLEEQSTSSRESKNEDGNRKRQSSMARAKKRG